LIQIVREFKCLPYNKVEDSNTCRHIRNYRPNSSRERTWRRWNDDHVASTHIIMQMNEDKKINIHMDVSRVYLDMYMLTTKYEVSVMNIYRTCFRAKNVLHFRYCI
jgi:hypothetical protein